VGPTIRASSSAAELRHGLPHCHLHRIGLTNTRA
jgi:hypothetical protein